MRCALDTQEIAELYHQSHSFPLDDQIESLVNPSTLAAKTLRFVGTLVQHYRPAYLIEFGSGLSTVFLTDILRDTLSAHVFTIDHSSYYLQKTRELVGQRPNVTFLYAPIALYQFRFKHFSTYQGDFVRKIPQGVKFDLVLIDGPPGYRFGREAPLYQIAPFLKPETLILLDDANREPEQEAIANWRRVWRDGLETMPFPELKKGLAVIQVRNPAKMSLVSFGPREIRHSWRRAKQAVQAERLRTGDES